VITPYIASQAEAGLTYSILQSRSSCLLKVKEEIDGMWRRRTWNLKIRICVYSSSFAEDIPGHWPGLDHWWASIFRMCMSAWH